MDTKEVKMCECGLVEINDCHCAEYSASYGPLEDPPWEKIEEDDIDWGEVDEENWDWDDEPDPEENE